MAWRCGSLPRSLISTARSSTIRRSTTTPLRPPPQPPLHGHRLRPDRTASIPNFGTIGGVIGCTQSLLPLHSVVAAARLTSHFAVEARACCELSQEYDVLRSNGEITRISELDFRNMNYIDLLEMYLILVPWQSRSFNYQKAFGAVKHGMLRGVRWLSMLDFQIGYELNRNNIWLPKINTELEGIEKLKTGALIIEPEMGLVFRRSLGEILFFRIAEAIWYSLAILIQIRDTVAKKMEKYKSNGERFVEMINDVLETRELIISKFVPHLLDQGFRDI